jgi:hypothetical protein
LEWIEAANHQSIPGSNLLLFFRLRLCRAMFHP